MLKGPGSLLVSVLLLSAFLFVATTKEAHAYIDIGTGSILLQTLLASIFGALFMIKVFWRRLTGQVSKFLATVRNLKGPVK